MARPNKPWFRHQSNAWVVKIRGRQYTLARGKNGKQEALQAFHRLMVGSGSTKSSDKPDIILDGLANAFLDHIERTCAKESLASYHYWILRFVTAVGKKRLASSITRIEAKAWADKHPNWAPSTLFTAVRRVKRMFIWAVDEEYLIANPLAKWKCPSPEGRETALNVEQMKMVLGKCPTDLLDVLRFMWATGCRPSEVYRVEARFFDEAASLIVMPGKTTRITKRNRILYLNAEAVEIIKRNAAINRKGPIFRDRNGNEWNCKKVSRELCTIRKDLGLGAECSAGGFRRGFATDAALHVPPSVLAHLLGHTSTRTLNKHYVKLHNRQAEMMQALDQVRPNATVFPEGDQESPSV